MRNSGNLKKIDEAKSKDSYNVIVQEFQLMLESKKINNFVKLKNDLLTGKAVNRRDFEIC
ncbi:MAG: hypothetical protein ACTHOB_10490 [Ginsengibacter sp.]